MFETPSDALHWYESEERVLTDAFLRSIPWDEVKHHQIDPAFAPVLTYMRDVEMFTEIYADELMKGAAGQEPAIRAFMERWSAEEPTHAELLNRFLEEAGFDPSQQWKQEAKQAIPKSHFIMKPLTELISHGFGKKFCSVHMTWGAINEYSTLLGYKRLWEAAGHPVLEKILRGIVREEARHALFYWSVARMELERSLFCQKLARFMIDRFWTPVGQGLKPKEDANLVIRTLFSGVDGIEFMDKHVNDRIAKLPGFDGFTTVTQRVAQVAS